MATHLLNKALDPSIALPPTAEYKLCPVAAPDLIAYTKLPDQLPTRDVSRQSFVSILVAFGRSYYPKSDDSIQKALKKLLNEEIESLVYMEGEFARRIRSTV